MEIPNELSLVAFITRSYSHEEIKRLVKLAFLNGGVYKSITTGSEENVEGPQLQLSM